MASYPATPVFDNISIQSRIKLPITSKKGINATQKTKEEFDTTYTSRPRKTNTAYTTLATIAQDDPNQPKNTVLSPVQITESTSLPANTYNTVWLSPESDITVKLPPLASTVKGASMNWRSYGPGITTIKSAIEDGEVTITTLAPDQSLLMAADYGGSSAGQWRIILGPTGTIGGGDVIGPDSSVSGGIVSFADTTGLLLSSNVHTKLGADGSIQFLADTLNPLNLLPINTGIGTGNWYLRNGVTDNVIGATTTDTLSHKTLIDTTNNITADSLRIGISSISVSTGSAPTVGQVLTAVNSSTATWQTPITPEEIAAQAADLLRNDTPASRAATIEPVDLIKKVNVVGTFVGTTPVVSLRCYANGQQVNIVLTAATCSIKGRLKVKSGTPVLDTYLPATNVSFLVMITAADSHEIARFTITTTGHIELCGIGPAPTVVTVYTWDNIHISYLCG